MEGVGGILSLANPPTILPCQLHEYLSDKDAYLTSNALLNGLYYPHIFNLDLKEPSMAAELTRNDTASRPIPGGMPRYCHPKSRCGMG